MKNIIKSTVIMALASLLFLGSVGVSFAEEKTFPPMTTHINSGADVSDDVFKFSDKGGG